MVQCREAYELPGRYYVEWGDQVEEWEDVQARAIHVELVQSEGESRKPWTAVYEVRFEEGPPGRRPAPRFYLVAE